MDESGENMVKRISARKSNSAENSWPPALSLAANRSH